MLTPWRSVPRKDRNQDIYLLDGSPGYMITRCLSTEIEKSRNQPQEVAFDSLILLFLEQLSVSIATISFF